MKVTVPDRVHYDAFNNYVDAAHSNMSTLASMSAFHDFLGMTKPQSRRFFRERVVKVNQKIARKIELLAQPHGYALLKAWEAQNGKA